MDQPNFVADEAIKENKPGTSKIKTETDQVLGEDQKIIKKDTNELQYFECGLCNLREKYEYFGKGPPFLKSFVLLEEAYVIEDPFAPPKQGEILIIGSHCVICRKMVCKDVNCSLYYDGTFCIDCAKTNINKFPKALQDKLNRVIR